MDHAGTLRSRSLSRDPSPRGLCMSEIKADVEQPETPTSILRNKGLRRSRRINYTEQEYDLIEEAAEMTGKPIDVFIREESLSVQFKARPFLRNAEVLGAQEVWRRARSRGSHRPRNGSAPRC